MINCWAEMVRMKRSYGFKKFKYNNNLKCRLQKAQMLRLASHSIVWESHPRDPNDSNKCAGSRCLSHFSTSSKV